MFPPLLLVLLSISTATATATATASSPPTLSAYQVLQAYGFPVGLLPKGVISYELDPSTGKFKVQFNGTCSFSIDGYDLKYKSVVTGTISKKKIKDLKGIQVKILFFWVNIIEVTNEGNELDFSVGIASATFPEDNFYESPQCGCGFDCAGVKTTTVSNGGGGLITSLRRMINPLFQI